MGDDKKKKDEGKHENGKKSIKIPDIDEMNLRDVFAAVVLHQLMVERGAEGEPEVALRDGILAYKMANYMLMARQTVPLPREGAPVTLDVDSLARLIGHEVEEV